MDSACYVIAEIGQNHQGSIDIAKKMMLIAKQCGVDCVKFQKSHLTSKFNNHALHRSYNSPHAWGETYGEHKAYLEFNEADFITLQAFANSINVDFSASAMDSVSLSFLLSMQLPFIKIGSGDAQNWPLIRDLAGSYAPAVLSTGMCDEQAVKKMYAIMSSYHKHFGIMHCVSSYPAPEAELNLNVITSFRRIFPDIVIGYSGHEMGYEHTITAVKLGAKLIERHFTLDKTWKGSDHSCSLNSSELSMLVNTIRALDSRKIIPTVALGSFEKTIQESEKACIAKLGKTVVAAKNLKTGTILQENDLTVKVAEPKGIHCGEVYEMIGKVLSRDVEIDESIFWDDLIGREMTVQYKTPNHEFA